MEVNETVVKTLNFYLKTYNGQTELIKKTKQRVLSLNPDADPKQQDEVKVMTSLKNKLTRNIEKYLEFFPVWSEWMDNIPGIGPFIGGNLILLYYFKFEPVCTKCGGDIEKQEGGHICIKCNEKLKGDGLLKYKLGYKDFPTISKWWKYMGREVYNGAMIKRKKGVVSNWSSLGRVVGFQFGDQINRQKETHLYKKFLLERKSKREKTHPESTKGHRHAMARHETIKLFLAHFWEVARTLDGLPVSNPYSGTILGHTNIIKPFYFNT